MTLGLRRFPQGVEISLQRMREGNGKQWFDVVIQDATTKNDTFSLDVLTLTSGSTLRNAIVEFSRACKFFRVPLENRICHVGFIYKHSSPEQKEQYKKEVEDVRGYVNDFYGCAINDKIDAEVENKLTIIRSNKDGFVVKLGDYSEDKYPTLIEAVNRWCKTCIHYNSPVHEINLGSMLASVNDLERRCLINEIQNDRTILENFGVRMVIPNDYLVN